MSFSVLRGEYEQAREFAEEALALHLELGTAGRDLVAAYTNVGAAAQLLGDQERALELYEHAAELARDQGDEVMLSALTHNIGVVRLEQGELAAARPDFEEALKIARRINFVRGVAETLMDMGYLELEERRVDEAAECLREALAVCRAGGFANEDLLQAVDGLAAVAVERGAPRVAVVLLAALARARAALALVDFFPPSQRIAARTLATARAELGEAAFAAAWAEGEALSLEEAAAAAERVH